MCARLITVCLFISSLLTVYNLQTSSAVSKSKKVIGIVLGTFDLWVVGPKFFTGTPIINTLDLSLSSTYRYLAHFCYDLQIVCV
jgi:hypothetical protein